MVGANHHFQAPWTMMKWFLCWVDNVVIKMRQSYFPVTHTNREESKETKHSVEDDNKFHLTK